MPEKRAFSALCKKKTIFLANILTLALEGAKMTATNQ